MINGYAKGGDITSALAKLAKLLSRGSEQAAPAIDRSVSMPSLSDVSGGSGRSAPRDPRMEQLQSLVTNQPTDGGYNQWAVVKPNGETHGAPFEFKGSALHVADGLNRQLPGHTVQALPTDLAPLDRFTPRAPTVDPMRKATADEIDQLLSSGQSPGMAEGGSFDPVSYAVQRVRGQSSPGSPGISGALRDALESLKSYFSGTQKQVAQDRDQAIMSQTEDHADGGTTGVSTDHEKAGLGKRFGVRVMEQAYGLDDQGKPALGGRAWTQGQGGTPAGILDEVASVPHNLLNLMHTTRSLDPIRKHLPGNAEGQAAEDSFFDRVDPQWSKDAADRLDRLRSSMNREYGVGEAHSFPEHMTDAAASLVSPVPMAAEGKEAGAAGRLLEMTMPLRPRTLKNAATDSAVLGGVGTGIDNLTQRLQRLRAQSDQQGGSGQQVDPEQFSHDMGVQPEDERPIHNNHEMVPLVGDDGNIVFGVDPKTFAAGGMVKPPTMNFKPPVLGHAQSPLGQAIQNKGNAGRYAGGMGLAPARPPRIPIPGLLRNIDQGLSQKKVQLRAIGGSLNQPAPQQASPAGPQPMDPHVHEVIMTALKHMKDLDLSSAAAVLRSSPEAMSHPEIAQVENALRNSTGITPATKTLNQLSQDESPSPSQQMQQLLPPLQSPGGGQPQGAAPPPGAGGTPSGPPQGLPGPSQMPSSNTGAPQPP